MKQHYERIALDDYIRTGEGGTALSYSHKDGKTLAKLFTKALATLEHVPDRAYRTSIKMGSIFPKDKKAIQT